MFMFNTLRNLNRPKYIFRLQDTDDLKQYYVYEHHVA